MKIVHYIIIAAGIIAVVLFSQFGNTVKPKGTGSNVVTGHDEQEHYEGDGHDHSDPNHTHEPVKAADFNTLLAAAKKRLPPTVVDQITLLENSITRGDLGQQKMVLYDSLGRIWNQNKNKKMAAYYIGESGKLENSEKKLNFAAHLVYEEIKEEPDPSIRQWLAELGSSFFDKALAINPSNEETIIESALFYIEGTNEPMKGVGQLLALVEKDPNNIPANTVLARMAMKSGQFDKAIERADKLIAINSKLLEPYLIKADALRSQDKKTEAISVLEASKTVVNNADYDKDVDEYIKSFK